MILELVVDEFVRYVKRTRRLDGDVIRGYAEEMRRYREGLSAPTGEHVSAEAPTHPYPVP